jgi:molybdate transport system permease protein
MDDFWPTLWLTLRLATLTTALLLVVGVPLAYALAFRRFPLRPVLAAVVSLPLVLPPTVLGFYLLLAFSPAHVPGRWLLDWFGVSVNFTFAGILIGSVLYSLPFMVQPVQAAFDSFPRSMIEASHTLGKSHWQTLRHVILPNIRPALLSGIVLSFAHTIGEFGVILMIGGNIPGETRVASIAIYDKVEDLKYAAANRYALVLLLISFALLLVLNRFAKNKLFAR